MSGQQFVYPMPMPMPGYPPQQAPVQPQAQSHAPQEKDDPLEKLVSKYRQNVARKAAKIIEDEETTAKRQPSMVVEDNSMPVDEMEREDLEVMLTRVKKGSREYEVITQELRQRELEEELSDFGEFGEEIDEITFYNVRVDDISNGDWVQLHTKVNYESKDEMLESVKREHQFATKVKWSKAVKDGVEVPGTTLRMRTLEEARMNLDRATHAIRKTDFSAQEAKPVQPPPNLSGEMRPLFEALSAQQLESTRSQSQLIQTLLQRPEPQKQDESEKMMRYMSMFKDMMVTPMIEMMKANSPKANDPRLSLELTQTILEAATGLSKMNGGGASAGGGDGMVMELVKMIGPSLIKGASMQNTQQQLQQRVDVPALGGPQQQQGTNPMQNMHARILPKIASALQFYVEGKLPVEQLPRWMFRGTLTDDEVIFIVNSNMETFSMLVKQAARSIGLIEAYFNRDDVKRGFQWVYEEIQRMAIILDVFEQEGRVDDRKALLEWPTNGVPGNYIPYPMIGEEARARFMQEQDIVEEGPDAQDPHKRDADLPPPQQVKQEPAKQETVREAQIHKLPIQNQNRKIKEPPQFL